jgi:hypothetical protein
VIELDKVWGQSCLNIILTTLAQIDAGIFAKKIGDPVDRAIIKF